VCYATRSASNAFEPNQGTMIKKNKRSNANRRAAALALSLATLMATNCGTSDAPSGAGGSSANAGSGGASSGASGSMGTGGSAGSGGSEASGGSGGRGGSVAEGGAGSGGTAGASGSGNAGSSGSGGGGRGGTAGTDAGSGGKLGSDGGDAGSGCPASPPADGSPCTGSSCFYQICASAGRVAATCANGTWSVKSAPCAAFSCSTGTPCQPNDLCVEHAGVPMKRECVSNSCGMGPVSCDCVPSCAGVCTVSGTAESGIHIACDR
jgi:hypothetical protein